MIGFFSISSSTAFRSAGEFLNNSYSARSTPPLWPYIKFEALFAVNVNPY
jgi:hypothetical protein